MKPAMKRRALLRTGAIALAIAALPGAVRPAWADADMGSDVTPAAGPAPTARPAPMLDVWRGKGAAYPVFAVRARMTAGASLQRVWDVLTDYDRLAEFVPDLTSSRLVAHDGGESIVAQEGFGKFLFIKQEIHLLVRVQEKPFTSLAVTLVKGNMHEYRADWTLTAIDPKTTQIDYQATIAPMFYVPALFGTALMRSDLRDMLAAVVREMETPAQKKAGSD